jgi:hypothetical protein
LVSDIEVIFSTPPLVGRLVLELIAMSLVENVSVKKRRTQISNWPDRLRRADASLYLREKHGVETAPQTLAKLAVSGGGPEYDLWGRIPYYPIEKLDEWVLSRLKRRRSTSDRGGVDRPQH